jgi:hypothetical protein
MENNRIPPARSHGVYRWRAELQHLRDEALVRLRHTTRQVRVEWSEWVRNEEETGAEYGYRVRGSANIGAQTQAAPVCDADPEKWDHLVTEMSGWLRTKEAKVVDFNNRAKTFEGGVVLGWGTHERFGSAHEDADWGV